MHGRTAGRAPNAVGLSEQSSAEQCRPVQCSAVESNGVGVSTGTRLGATPPISGGHRGTGGAKPRLGEK